MPWKSPFVERSLHIFALSGFALPQPLFGLLAIYPEFFIARQSQPSDVLLLVLILCVGVPALLVLVEGGVRAVAPQLDPYVHGSLIWIFAWANVIQIVKSVWSAPGSVVVGVAILLATAASVAYHRFGGVRNYLTVLSPAALVFPCLFLLNPGINKIVFPERGEARFTGVGSNAPVVMVVLDEFPLSSILDEGREIDPVRFPNLARLAGDSHWFRNATTVSDSTLLSVPAILSGLRPHLHDQRLPTVGDYPNNLFTLLGNSHSLNVTENCTQLSPEQVVLERGPERMAGLLSDMTTVYAHVLLPTDLTSALPAIDQSWKDFGSVLAAQPEIKTLKDFQPEIETNRKATFNEFVEAIQTSERPPLFFIHMMLPHIPWQYLPSGKQYSLTSVIPGLVSSDSGHGMFPAWSDDRSLVVQGYRRHVLQAGFVDALVGELVSKLKQVGLYDPSLIVITADHGVSFRPNDFQRRLTETNYPDIAWVPLIIKEPHQKQGTITDRNVETIDIVPTMADILDVELPWVVDGVSALDPAVEERLTKTVLAGKTEELVFDPRLDRFDDALERKLQLLGSGPWKSLFAQGPHADLVGSSLDSFQVDEAGFEVEIEGEAMFEDIDLEAPFLPTRISGSSRIGDNAVSRYVAISVNDRIQAVTEMLRRPSGADEFSTMVPGRAFAAGKNDVEVFRVSGGGGQIRLTRLSRESRPEYVLMSARENEAESLQTHDGMIVPINAVPNSGWVRTEINEATRTIAIMGWALNVTRPASDVTVLIFQHKKLLHSGKPSNERPDVAEVFPTWELSTPGFRFDLPLSKFDRDAEVRVLILLGDGTATESAYVKDGWVFPLE